MAKKPLTRDGAVAAVKDPANWMTVESTGTMRMLVFTRSKTKYVKFQRWTYKNHALKDRPFAPEPDVGWSDIGSIYEWDDETKSTIGGESMTSMANRIYMSEHT